MIPQGVASLTEPLLAAARIQREEGTVVVGYTAAFLLTDEDRDAANALYNVEHLLELWEEIPRAPRPRGSG